MKTTLKAYKSNMGTKYKHFPFQKAHFSSCDAFETYTLIA